MSQVLRSKLCGPHDSGFDSPASSLCHNHDGYDSEVFVKPVSPFMVCGSSSRNAGSESFGESESGGKEERSNGEQVRVLAILVAALRKSLITCSVEREEICSMDISWPTNVRHIAHVTFDRFNGFLGLPVEFEPEVPRRAPSASASVFGVSAESMQCSYDHRGNSVPTILLMMQRRLYSQGGLQAEGIFRINAENGQEEFVRYQLNNGIVPHGIDFHCLAGLIKAWFRELPTGVLDSLTPEQVMHCNTEDDCTQLVRMLPPTEAALLDWVINLMADVVQHEHHNKMNARNIAMVFAPNMTQMADPLTALIHAVQVMNFLKTLVTKTVREREESAGDASVPCSCTGCTNNNDHNSSMSVGVSEEKFSAKILYNCDSDEATLDKFLDKEGGLGSDEGESFRSFQEKSEADDEVELISEQSSPVECRMVSVETGDYESILDRLSLTKGVKKLCRHPVFQLSRPVKKTEVLGL